MFLKTMNAIDAVGTTTSRCSVKTKIRINEHALGFQPEIDKLNKLKYLLSLNETKLFELWPQPKNDTKFVHQDHISFIQPKNLYLNSCNHVPALKLNSI